jgi:hypothetical protein
MSKNSTSAETRRSKPLSPDVMEVLHMLTALESQPKRPQGQSSGE